MPLPQLLKQGWWGEEPTINLKTWPLTITMALGIFCGPLINYLNAEPKTPLPDTAYNGGIISAESLGRGQTFASNMGSAASGSENPAALESPAQNGIYTNIYLSDKSDLPSSTVKAQDPLQGKTMNYLSFFSENGTIFFEPMGRFQGTTGTTTGSETVKFSADAIGFAGAKKWKNGSFGLSLSYIHASLFETQTTTGQPDISSMDTGDGFRLNLGFRYPVGPTMCGIVLQNFPGFVFWKDYKRDLLPVGFRAGNTWQLSKRQFLSFELERRYYNEGSNATDIYYTGYEDFLTDRVAFRFGVYSDDLGNSKKNRYTGGATLKLKNKLTVSFAGEKYQLEEKKVTRYFMSFLLPFYPNAED